MVKNTLANLYDPNENKPLFYTRKQQNVSVVFCGDRNLILNRELVTDNYNNIVILALEILY